MDDDDDTALAVSNRRPRKAWSDSKAFRRLQRELRGGDLRWDPRFHKPAETYCETPDRSEHVYWLTSSKRVLKSVRLDLLHGQHELRDYIILGEKPTFPHQLVTICRPHHQSSPDPVPSTGEDNLKPGSICYWTLDLASRSIKEVASVDYHASSLSLCDYSLSAAFTAWDIDHDKLAQVLVWDFAVDGILDRPSEPNQRILQKLEFRYGADSVVIDHDCAGERPIAIGACFAGLPGTQRGVGVRVLFSRKVVLYEPFGGSNPRIPAAASEFWKPAPETPLSSTDDATVAIPPPLITTIDISRIAASHLKTVLKSYADTPPRFTYARSAFIPSSRPLRFGPGERERFDRRCILAFGAVESQSRMYHLFVIALDAAAHTHRVLVAKAFSSSVVFCWENMVAAEAADLLARALERVVSVRKGRHDCRVDCEPVVGGFKGFEEFGWEAAAVEGICMRELGVVLKGWGAKRGVS